MVKVNEVGHLYTLLGSHREEALKTLGTPRLTQKHSTGDPMIDEYIGGGYGREGNYEIVLIFGTTGVNKSTFASQLVLNAALKGTRIAYFSLEDDRVDVYKRFYYQCKGLCGGKFSDPMELLSQVEKQVLLAPESDGYTLDAMAREVEEMFRMGIEIIVVDPLQFIFEASVDESPESEFNRQRKFMRQLNNVMKRVCHETGKSKTIIIVSHTNKGKYDDPMDTIVGSGAVKQVPTKIIQVIRDDKGLRFLRLCKTRFTQHRLKPHQVELDTDSMYLRTPTIPPDWQSRSGEWWQKVRNGWNGLE